VPEAGEESGDGEETGSGEEEGDGDDVQPAAARSAPTTATSGHFVIIAPSMPSEIRERVRDFMNGVRASVDQAV
jgi:hypothetical protein